MSYRLSVPWTLGGAPTIVPLPSFDSLVGAEETTRIQEGNSSSPAHSDTKLEYVEEPFSEASIGVTGIPIITPEDSASQHVPDSGQDKEGQGTASPGTSVLTEMMPPQNPFDFPINQRKIPKSSHYTRWYLLKTPIHPDFPPETPPGVVLRENDLFVSREVNETSQEKMSSIRIWKWTRKRKNVQVDGMRWKQVVLGETCTIEGCQRRLDLTINGDPRWIQPDSFTRKHRHRDATNSIL